MDRWCSTRNVRHGGTISLDTCWALAMAWYHDRLRPDYRRKTPEELRAVLTSLGMTGPFWSVA